MPQAEPQPSPEPEPEPEAARDQALDLQKVADRCPHWTLWGCGCGGFRACLLRAGQKVNRRVECLGCDLWTTVEAAKG